MPGRVRTRRPATTAGADVVPGYPADLEQHVVLADGRNVFIRPVRPDDAHDLRAAIENADPETLYSRFLGSPPHDEASIRRLVEVDYVTRLALAAFAPDGSGVAIARYEGSKGNPVAEVAVAVDPVWRNIGLATCLVRMLGRAAIARGITEFSALLLSQNHPVMGVLDASGLPFTVSIEDATSTVMIHLREPVDPSLSERVR